MSFAILIFTEFVRSSTRAYQLRATRWVSRPKTLVSAESAIHCPEGLGPGPDSESGFELVGPNEPYEAGRWPESNGYH